MVVRLLKLIIYYLIFMIAVLVAARLIAGYSPAPAEMKINHTVHKGDTAVAEDFCPAGGYLAIEDGLVAIYSGRPGSCGVLEEITGIALDEVRPGERERLRAGIPFDDDDQQQLLLDGLIID